MALRVLAILAFVILISCDSSSKRNTDLLPPASGKPGEMIVVVDSTLWQGSVGEAVRETFGQEVRGLARPQSMFKMNRVEPSKMTRILRTVKNLVFIVTLNSETSASRRIRSYFSEEALNRIKNDPDLFVIVDQDVFARGQQVMYLFGQNAEQLAAHINQNGNNLLAVYNQAENNRLRSTLFKGATEKGIMETFTKTHSFYMNVPFGYQMVESEPGFAWIRQMNDDNDKNIFISYIPYTSDKLFTQDGLISFRDSIAQGHLFGNPDRPESFLLTETSVPFIPVEIDQVEFQGKYAVNMTGLWRTNTLSMGGPFTGYAMVDEKLNRFYYVEGFVYSPGTTQRELMREMRVVLSTFRTSDMNNNSQPAATSD